MGGWVCVGVPTDYLVCALLGCDNLPQFMFELQQCQLLYISTLAIAELGSAQSLLVIDAIQSTNPSAKNRRNIGPQD